MGYLMRFPLFKSLAIVMVLLLSACASSNTQSLRAGTSKAVISTEVLPAPDSTSAEGAYVGVSEYRIGAHDLLQISVFQVEDLDREVRVNSSGMISMPLIGAMQAGGRTVQELERLIAGKLTEGYLQSPQVSVFVKEFTSQRVTVEGSVKKPGIFPITGRTSLLQAVAMAEGLDPLADHTDVVIFRNIKGQRMAALFDLRAIRAGNVEDPVIYGDDIVVVDQSSSKSALKSITDGLRGFIGFRTF